VGARQPQAPLPGDGRSAGDVARLMTGCHASMALLDPPVDEEMSSPDVVRLLGKTLDAAASVSREGAVHFVGVHWRELWAKVGDGMRG
jgi:hypothetical protein